ncbi:MULTISPECIES: ATP-dependent Clp protease adaptor ClpS [Campylobacter]|uniref:ATP-dependent Clp protease adapter protein ClpS n=1 Tax=Campylobacter vicugnae TaxID=1660076 RepID=A0A1X9T0S5_9BACT|nr:MULTISPECIES: ATP-dependent Clp protease adaptor ClpS [unclassified Campylobacter]MCR8689293.1 ATP-dependent Clp protease adaptor ClpS [Campylobacter sp. RM9264]MCR8700631.1 ATP-dependent Clp protease adaptor ClpS [Campylobacter sp. RM12176]ARR02118.1 ATP-dependent Clp protease adaptor protein ClpS [Campylobacter sp. RM8964]ARR03799.1 ATP-dependent Clp protease adaptor protein ClpS [Campylobacter sp. RM12175]MBE6429479.1 ATP-dependent Clp protease adaptor ClpS [Campylobacter sp.]
MQTKRSLTSKTKLKEFKPTLYKVILLNDDVTTMDFVVMILCEIFNKELNQAVNLMMQIHKNGSAICGIYTKEIAQTKQSQTLSLAKANGFPLKCVIKED